MSTKVVSSNRELNGGKDLFYLLQNQICTTIQSNNTSITWELYVVATKSQKTSSVYTLLQLSI